jgi:magnesium-transporting ATPase (P-type)
MKPYISEHFSSILPRRSTEKRPSLDGNVLPPISPSQASDSELDVTVDTAELGGPDAPAWNKAPAKRNNGSNLARSFLIGVHHRDRGGGDPSGAHQTFRGNAVSTTKYELWNILPKNLLEQFQRAANFWFLIVATCQMLPFQLSPTNEFATVIPLCCVLILKLCKDAYEDQKRRRDDHRLNSQLCSVLDPESSSKLRSTRWKDVRVGDYVRLVRDEPIPADMILLSCLNEDGTAFVDTAQLDGETSLKPKYVLEPTMRITSAKELFEIEGHVASEPPNQLVQSFNGMLFLQGHPRGYPIEANNFLLRGSTLRNTAWAFGLVVFTGHDTKLVQNLKPTPYKRSNVEVMANYLLLIVFGVLVLAAVLSTILRSHFMGADTEWAEQLDWVWPEKDPLQDNKYLAFVTFMIGYNNLIPISLYVTVDLVRTFQAVLMERDPSMYHKETDSPCRVRNSGLNENLGQVEFVLTDKTGTLTENHMQFKAFAVFDKVYGCWDSTQGPVDHVVAMPPPHVCMPLDRKLARAQGQVLKHSGSDIASNGSRSFRGMASAPAVMATQQSTSTEPEEKDMTAEPRRASLPSMEVPDNPGREEEIIDQFFLCLATCHTAIVEQRKGGGVGDPEVEAEETLPSGSSSNASSLGPLNLARGLTPPEKVAEEAACAAACAPCSPQDAEALRREAEQKIFRSSSPDEEALVAAARDYGYFFRRKATARGVASQLTVNVRGRNQYYNVLICNEFSSDRKRMSVLVRRTDSVAAGCAGLSAKQKEKADLEPSPMMTLERLPLAHEIEQMDTSDGSQHPAVLYAKGADNVMLERLCKRADVQAQAEGIKRQLQRFFVLRPADARRRPAGTHERGGRFLCEQDAPGERRLHEP